MLESRALRTISVVDAAINDLRESIVSGEIAAGKQLTEAALVRRWGVSRPTVEAAIRALGKTGLLTASPYKSAVVTEFTPVQVYDMGVARCAIEAGVLSEVLRDVPETRVRATVAILRSDILGLQATDTAGAPNRVRQHEVAFHNSLIEMARNERLSGMWGSYRYAYHTAINRFDVHYDIPEMAADHGKLLDDLEGGIVTNSWDKFEYDMRAHLGSLTA